MRDLNPRPSDPSAKRNFRDYRERPPVSVPQRAFEAPKAAVMGDAGAGESISESLVFVHWWVWWVPSRIPGIRFR